jgi:hypothetical protein
MKRFGEKATREALENGAVIREWEWFAGGGYRVIIEGEGAGYITESLFYKLKEDGTIGKGCRAYSFTDYAKAEAEAEEATEPAPEAAEEEKERKTMTREGRQELNRNRAVLIEAHQNATIPAEAAAALIKAIGYEAAAETVAVMIVAKGTYDGRVSDRSRAWAAGITSETFDSLREAYIFYCDEIHPAHMEQIAEAMRSGDALEAAEIAAAEKTEEEWNAESDRVHAAVLASLPEAANEEATEAEPEETERERTDRENRKHCKHIADELERYAEGEVYRCTECGEICTIEEAEDEDGFTIYRTSCGCALDYEPDQMSVYDFIADALDIEVSCGLDREYRSARVMVACGGPNIYIDTARKAVELYWWTDRAEYPISSSAADALDEAIAEYWEVR